jgi:hypothetical protein
MFVRIALAAAVIGPMLVLGAGCGALDAPAASPTETPSAATANLFQNPGFEEGDQPWTFRDQAEWRPFEVDDTVAYTGSRSARLEIEGAENESGTRIAGAIQNINPETFPEYVSGFYRVDEWRPDAPFQYVQFVVSVLGGDFGDGIDVHQLRLPLAGAEREPFALTNARWVFINRDQPDVGEWTYFGYPIKRAFELNWGRVPGSWDSIDVFFEVRYDDKVAGSTPAATVFFDDLYAGPQSGNPNRPADDIDE